MSGGLLEGQKLIDLSIKGIRWGEAKTCSMDSSLQWINLNSWVVDPFTANTEEFNPKLQLSKAEIIIVGCFKLSYVV